jgi:basic membrane protein A
MNNHLSHTAISRLKLLVVVGVVFALIAAACSSGDSTADETTTQAPTTTQAAATTEAPVTTAAPETTTTEAPDLGIADFNGDGVVRIGVATDGSRDDGAYYQALVETVEEISAENGYEDPVIVDNIDPANSRSELENLAEQGVDVVAIGSGALADGNDDLYTEYDDVFWYCNCGSGTQPIPGLLQSSDSGAELNLSAGYATGLLLKESGGDSTTFLGCCDLNFEVESLKAMEFGLSLVDESYTVTYVPTGNFPYDFDNTAGATEAYNNALAEGMDAVYPFLGGAAEPIAKLADADDLIVLAAGSSTACDRDDIDYDIQVKFDAGDYLVTIFSEILSGEIAEGGIRYFTVGIDPQVGAEFCHATPEQEQELADLNARIGAGDFGDEIYEILSEAYGF